MTAITSTTEATTTTVELLQAEIVKAEAAIVKKALSHYRNQGNRAKELKAIVPAGEWKRTCTKMGFTPQSVDGWIRVSERWSEIKEKVADGTIRTLRAALDHIANLDRPPQKKKEKGTERQARVERLATDLTAELPAGNLILLLKRLAQDVPGGLLADLIQHLDA